MVEDRRHHNPEGRSDIAKRITGDGYTEGAADYDANRRQVDKCIGAATEHNRGDDEGECPNNSE